MCNSLFTNFYRLGIALNLYSDQCAKQGMTFRIAGI